MHKRLEEEALKYHSEGKPGKVDVRSSKPCDTEEALSLAYSPGVAVPCLAIEKDPQKAYEYTAKGNLVAVVSNGTAVLGLGDIGALAGKPVMEGKGVLFKKFAFIDVFDIEISPKSIDEVVNCVKALEPTFGGINLEDIKAPECFDIEERLKKEMNIPVFHDDQHGTAIISGAALINACELTKRKMSELKLVVNGAGAAAISCSRIFKNLGVKKENILMCDSKGVLYKGRKEGMNKYKDEFVVDTPARTLADAVKDADAFIGLSVGGALTPEMLKTMAPNAIVFAMANPDPEIDPPVALKVRPDIIMATGRSDYPNQVNNVLGFPYIFRGALDVRATAITEKMKMAAVHALAQLAREEVPEKVCQIYQNRILKFNKEYIIPKPFDERVLLWVAPAVAKAAMESGVAQKPILDFKKYREQLEALQGNDKAFLRESINRLHSKHSKPISMLFVGAENEKTIKAIKSLLKENIISPVLIGNKELIEQTIKQLALTGFEKIQIINSPQDPLQAANQLVLSGQFDTLFAISGDDYTNSLRTVLKDLGERPTRNAFGLSIVLKGEQILLLADTSININPSAEQLAQMALASSEFAQFLGLEPKVALLNYCNICALKNPSKMQKAVEIIHHMQPKLIAEGDIQVDTALNPQMRKTSFPNSDLKDKANILIFPDLDSANISVKLASQLGDCKVLYPLLVGTKKTVNVVQNHQSVETMTQAIILTALQFSKNH